MSIFLERTLAIHSSPAICGIKASNLINIKYSDDLFKEIEELNSKYPNLSFNILRIIGDKALILIYRKNVLDNELKKKENINYLKSLGYDVSSTSSMINCLKEKIKDNDFPHEIGVFLGYDLSDIKSFVSGKKCIYVGYWKVYSNLEEKKKIFNRYTRCKDCVTRLIDRGFPIENFMR